MARHDAPRPFLAPSLRLLRSRLNTLWPDRDTRSDGWLGDAAHAARRSDHNPDGRGMVHALDIDRDGIDVQRVLRGTIGHSAVEYVIFNRLIYYRVREFRPRRYDGLNAHRAHVHVSLRHSARAEHWVGTWLPDTTTTKRTQERTQEGRSDVSFIVYYVDQPRSDNERGYTPCAGYRRAVPGSEVESLRRQGFDVAFVALRPTDAFWLLPDLELLRKVGGGA
jgi:hypothetical protein